MEITGGSGDEEDIMALGWIVQVKDTLNIDRHAPTRVVWYEVPGSECFKHTVLH